MNLREKGVKRKESFWGQFYRIYGHELQILIGVLSIIVLFEADMFIVYKIKNLKGFEMIEAAFYVLIAEIIAGVVIVVITLAIFDIIYNLRVLSRMTYLPLTRDEMEAVGIDTTMNEIRILAEYLYFAVTEIFKVKPGQVVDREGIVWEKVIFAFRKKLYSSLDFLEDVSFFDLACFLFNEELAVDKEKYINEAIIYIKKRIDFEIKKKKKKEK